jgi:hypothetical protein
MRTILTEEKINCDCCNKPLSKPLFYINDGSYQENFIRYKELDICFICASRLFQDYADKLDLNVEEIKDKYLDLKESQLKKIGNIALKSFLK